MNHRRGRLMIVEDEQIVALDLRDALEDLGHTVVGHASTAPSAIDLVAETRPDLILMDINLSGRFDGIHAAKEIREKHNLPVIFVTAYDDDATLLKAQVTEPHGYILKPFQTRELRVCIELALFRHQMQRERERLARELKAALDENKILHGVLPICSQCREIRDENNAWVSLESYVGSHSAAHFTHAMCPGCQADYLAGLKRLTTE